MPDFKLVLSDPKSGKSVQRELKEENTKALHGKKIGEAIKGESIDLPGYEFVITGGSDAAGFPMRWDVSGTSRKRITTVSGVGVKNRLRKPNPKKKGWRTINGMKLKKTVAGNTIHAKTAQVNLKVTKIGRENLFAEAKPEEAPAEEAKGGDEKVEEPQEAKQPETVPEKTEEVAEKVEEVPIADEGEPLEKKEEPAEKKDEEKADPLPVEEPKGTAVTPQEHSESVQDEAEAKGEEKKEEPAEEKKEEAPAEEKKEEPAEEPDKGDDEVDKIDEELKKDEEEIKKEDEEIEKIEKELESEGEEKKEE